MIFFDHADRARDLPAWFASPEVEEARRQIDAFLSLGERERAQTDPPPVWKLPVGRQVLDALEQRSMGLCAFCEQRAQLAAWRFRPPAHAMPMTSAEERIAYLWRSFEWSNFFPICRGCTPAPHPHFPVEGPRETPPPGPAPDKSSGSQRPSSGDVPQTVTGAHQELRPAPDEVAILYHPGEPAEPASAFRATLHGALIPLDRRAQETVKTYRLDRPELVAARSKLARDLVGRLDQAPDRASETLHRLTGLRRDEATPIPDDLQFPGFAYLVFRQLFADALGRLGIERPLSLSQIMHSARALERNADFPRALTGALATARTEADATARTGEALRPPPLRDDTATRRDHPRLAQIALRDFKSLEAIDLTLPAALDANPQEILAEASMEPPSAPCLLILGENATGKSSILEGVALACLDAPARAALAESVGLSPRRLTLDPRYMGAPEQEPRDRASVEIVFHPEEPDETGRRLRLTARRDASGGVFDERDDLPGPRPFVFAYGPNRIYGSETLDTPWRHYDTLFESGRRLSNPEAWLVALSQRDDGALDMVVAALRHIIQIDGRFETIEIAPDPLEGDALCAWIHLTRNGPEGRKSSVRQRLAFASAGYRAVLALVCDVLQGLMADGTSVYEARTSNAVVLIDEIEAHLHPRWKLQIISGLRRALPRATFLLTSHDPLCVRGMHPGEVLMLSRHLRAPEAAGDGPAEMEVVERVSDFGAFERLTIEQLLTSDMFQLVSVDDPRAEQRYAEVATLLGRQAAAAAGAPDAAPLTAMERDRLRAFHDEVADGMPAGVTEVTTLVQKAVADFLRDRRRLDAAARRERRAAVEQDIRAFLEELLR